MRYRTGTGGEVIIELKSQWRPSQSRKESIVNCLFIGTACLGELTTEREKEAKQWQPV